ncbi:MAG: IS630 family transposase [Gammaproteobacteria bacterium]|nr:IS630 family transposase [Gammaproteobacteria bacterium]
MPAKRQRPGLNLTDEQRSTLTVVSRSRTDEQRRVERAQILLAYAEDESIAAIVRRLGTYRRKVERLVDKALELGPLAALDDLKRCGRPAAITPEARAWLLALACEKPKELGYSYELWTTELLARHAREHCRKAGHSSLARLSRGTVSKILNRNDLRPHKVRYYLERRDPEFDRKMVEVLHVYREVEVLREQGGDPAASTTAYLSYDEKPSIQALGTTSEDLPPVPGAFDRIYRDYEYVRHGTLSLLAGIDLLTGHIHGLVAPRHRSREFIEFLKLVHEYYPVHCRIRVVLDNHSSHISKETRAYLKTVPNRFEFIFTPKHGSWLNLIECFFARMAKTVLRGIRVASKEELADRIRLFLKEVNQTPVQYRWKYGLDELT